MKAMHVVRREYTELIRRKSFIVTTLWVPIMMSMFFVLPVLFATVKPQNTIRVAVLDQSGILAEPFVAALTDTLKNGERQYIPAVVPATGATFDQVRTEQIDAVKRGETDIVLAISQGIMTGEKASYITREQRSYNVLERFQKVMNDVVLKQRLAAEGLDYERVKNLTAGVSVEMNLITATGAVEKKNFLSEYGVVFVFVMLLFSSIQSWGLTIAKSIVEEKGSRIIEVLLNALEPRDLIIGKLLGVGMAGFTQLGIWTIVGLTITGGAIPFALAKLGPMNIPPITFLYFVVFFVLGFMLFSSLYMVIGAMSSTDQDVQQMQATLTLFMLVPVMSLMMFMQNPGSPVAVGMSLFPPFTPMAMMARIILLTPPLWQILLGIGLMLATILFGVTFAARVFRVGILMHGKRPSLRELVHWYRMAG
jgi:ABC-2 type transport system permease protein